MDEFANVYEDADRASAYARLEFPGTYFLAYRDLSGLLGDGRGRWALDFGCGAGRSTRFLESYEFDTIGVDISAAMLDRARATDPSGDYRLVGDGDLSALGDSAFDIVLAAFTFDNIAGDKRREAILRGLAGRLRPRGAIVLIVSSPEIYRNEWASFTTAAFPENATAESGDIVRIVMTDVDDPRPIEDIVTTDDDYRRLFARVGLRVDRVLRPLGLDNEPFEWRSETTIAPWTLYRLELLADRDRSRLPWG